MNKIFIDLEFHPIDSKYASIQHILSDEIIQIGAVKLNDNDEEISSFNRYVKPQYVLYYSKYIKRLTKIKEENIWNGDIFSNVMKEFIAWCFEDEEDFTIYSWSDNDIKQLCVEMFYKNMTIDARIDYMISHWENFQESFDELLGFKRNLSLENAIFMSGIEMSGQLHNALDDARNTALLYIYSKEKKETTIKLIKDVMEPKCHLDTIGDLFDANELKARLNMI